MYTSRRSVLASVGTLAVGSSGCLRLRNEPGRGVSEIPTSEEVWTYDAESAIHHAPVQLGSELVFASEDGVVHTIDAEGTERQSLELNEEIEGGVARGEDSLFVGTSNGILYRITPGEGVVWNQSVGSEIESPPRVTETAVYVPTRDGSIVTLDSTDGTELWRFQPEPSSANMVPAVDDDRLFVGLYTNSVYALSRVDSEVHWETELGDSILSSPTVAGDTVFIGSDDETLYALNADDGDQQWQFETDAAVWTQPAVTSETVVFGNNAGMLYGVARSDGSERWSVGTAGSMKASPVIESGTVYAVNDAGQVGGGEVATGETQWQYELDSEVLATPLALPDRDQLIVATMDGTVHALQTTV